MRRLQRWLVPVGDDAASLTALNLASLLLFSILAAGLAARVWAAKNVSPHVDEPASLLPAMMTAERGWPKFPSGAPYLQGATLSYILAPLIKFGHLDLYHYRVLRLVSVAFGTGAIYFTYRLGVAISRRAWVGLAAALMIMLDPLSVEWSAHIRMYAPLEMIAVIVVLLVHGVLVKEPSRRQLAGLAVVFWLGIFTHIALALFLPPMFLVALAVYRDRLWKDRKDILLCGIVCGLAPFALTVLNEVLSGGRGASTEGGSFSFVGDHLIDFGRIFHPAPDAWEMMFGSGNLVNVMPLLFFLANGILIGGYYLWGTAGDEERNERFGVTSLLLINWLSVGAVAAFTVEGKARYLLHTQPLGFLLFILGAREIMKAAHGASIKTMRGASLRLGMVGLLALEFINVGTGLRFLINYPVVDTDYIATALYVKENRKPGQVVYTAISQAAYVALGSTDGIEYLAGNPNGRRSDRYLYPGPNGTQVDFWLGVPAVQGAGPLCMALRATPGAWILADGVRLNSPIDFKGSYATVISGSSVVKFRGVGASYAMQVKPYDDWSPAARATCNSALQNYPAVVS